MSEKKPEVGLFVTCLVDLFRPTVGFAAIKLLEDAGCTVHVPEDQTCCGQPAFNSGDRQTARQLAIQVMDAFEHFDCTVLPSGSCAGMMKHHYPGLFGSDPALQARARRFSEKVFELTTFLSGLTPPALPVATLNEPVTYHDSCTGLRQLGIKAQPRKLLKRLRNVDIREMADAEVCCGFGGSFCMKFPEISQRMAADKVQNILSTGARRVLGGDMGCLLNIRAALKQAGATVEATHVAEILAGMERRES